MLDFLFTILPSFNSGSRTGREPGLLRPRLELKKAEGFEFEFESSPLLENKGFEEKSSGNKLKIVMRKEAAFRLLSKCRNGGRLEYEDVAKDLKKLSADGGYVRVFSCNSKHE